MALLHSASLLQKNFHRKTLPHWQRSLCALSLLGLVFCAGPLGAEEKTSLLQQGSKLLGLGADRGSDQAAADESDITAAFRQALEIGSTAVIQQLGQEDGYLNDDIAHIVLPKSLRKVKKTLGKVGLEGMMEDLEVSLNRAAETATPQAQALFVQAIQDMSFNDVVEIYQGPEDSATQYFRGQMSDPLKEAMRPLVSDSLSQVGAIQLYDQAIERYGQLPFVPEVSADLTEYVLDASLDGIFHYLAEQEKAIRQNPLRQTTDLLKKVFGG